MKILITGGAGYIGSILTPLLLERGCQVVVLDNFSYGQTTLLECCQDPEFKIVRGDARDERLITKLIKTVDCIIPLACIVGAPACDQDPITAKSINLEAIQLILRLRSKDQMLIYPNTNSGYGIGEKNVFCDENTPLNPISLYGRLKVQAEKEILNAGQAVTLRLATVFGVSPRMRWDLLVNDFVYRALTDRSVILFEANFKRNYVHIDDVAWAFYYSLENFERMKNEAFNVGLSEANLSKLELCQEIQKQIPDFHFIEAAVGEDPDKRNYIVSNSKIERMGFKAQVTLQEGIAELVKGFQIARSKQFRNA